MAQSIRESSRTVPGAVDVLGRAHWAATITANSQQDGHGRGEYFRQEVNLGAGSTPLWKDISVTAGTESPATGHLFVPPSTENYSYDDDGNLTGDGRWTYTWDAENRLIRMVSKEGVQPAQRIDFTYDWQSRRISKKVWNNTQGAGNPVVDQRFVYDGWNLLAVLTPNSQLLASFTWGLDLSGSLQGAGGVGGLLFTRSTLNNPVTTQCVSYDGNGNVMALVNAADGTVAGSYEYGPFGETVSVTGTPAVNHALRFSTKYQDAETGYLYYGYRSYNPHTGRWLSRDPIGERDGEDLYGFCANEPLVNNDAFGLYTVSGNVIAVESGDTLWAISQGTGIPLADLLAANSGSDLIKPGQQLNIGPKPSKPPKPVPPTPSPTGPLPQQPPPKPQKPPHTDATCKCGPICKSGTWTGELLIQPWALVIGLHKFTGSLQCAGQPDLTAQVWGWNGGWGLGLQWGFKEIVVKDIYCCAAFEGYKDWWTTGGVGWLGWGDVDGLNLPSAMLVGVTFHGAKCSK